MPHECTNCSRTFPDGSKEMLSGCPDCGGNKFQFAPSGQMAAASADSATANAADSASAGTEPAETGEPSDSAGTVERAAETVRGWVSSDSKTSEQSPQTDAPDASRVERDASATTAQSSDLDRSADADRREQSDRSWPSSEESLETKQSAETEAFTEWPDTARRPEDRSETPDFDAGEIERDGPDSDSATAGQGGSTDTPTSNRSVSNADRPTRATIADSENTAQSDARTEVVSSDDLPGEADQQRRDDTAVANQSTSPVDGENDHPPDHGRVVSEPSGDQPSIEELRAELNEQFESIKIVSPGQYELNLMELYNREEYIISLQEDGRYVIDVPDSWHADDE